MGREIIVTDMEKDKTHNGVALILHDLSFDKIYVPPEDDSLGQVLVSQTKEKASEVDDSLSVKAKITVDRRVRSEQRTVPQPFTLATEDRSSSINRRGIGICPPPTRINSKDITGSAKGSKVNGFLYKQLSL